MQSINKCRVPCVIWTCMVCRDILKNWYLSVLDILQWEACTLFHIFYFRLTKYHYRLYPKPSNLDLSKLILWHVYWNPSKTRRVMYLDGKKSSGVELIWSYQHKGFGIYWLRQEICVIWWERMEWCLNPNDSLQRQGILPGLKLWKNPSNVMQILYTNTGINLLNVSNNLMVNSKHSCWQESVYTRLGSYSCTVHNGAASCQRWEFGYFLTFQLLTSHASGQSEQWDELFLLRV